MFGTNFPMLTGAQALKHLDALDLEDEARDLFLSGNAQRVFRLDPTPVPAVGDASETGRQPKS
jgi:predicted TIM-barrel fold metal-dependent hydrolase